MAAVTSNSEAVKHIVSWKTNNRMMSPYAGGDNPPPPKKKKSGSQRKILVARRMIRSKFLAEERQISGATVRTKIGRKAERGKSLCALLAEVLSKKLHVPVCLVSMYNSHIPPILYI